jgi:hypothetical protein
VSRLAIKTFYGDLNFCWQAKTRTLTLG